LLVKETTIDQVYETRREISRCLSAQWFGQFVFPKSWADTWLLVGLSRHISNMFTRNHFGANEYRYRLKIDMEKIITMDFERLPLYPPGKSSDGDHKKQFFEDFEHDEFVNLKAPVVIAMLDRFLGKNMIQKVEEFF
jgi:aminopeptidase N